MRGSRAAGRLLGYWSLIADRGCRCCTFDPVLRATGSPLLVDDSCLPIEHRALLASSCRSSAIAVSVFVVVCESAEDRKREQLTTASMPTEYDPIASRCSPCRLPSAIVRI